MRGHRGFQNSTAYLPKLNSADLSAINLAVLRVFGFGLGTGSAILLVPPPNLLKRWRKGWATGTALLFWLPVLPSREYC